MDEYLDQVGSLNATKVDDTSFKDIKNFVKDEVDFHQKCLNDACDEKSKEAENGTKDDTNKKGGNVKFYAYSTKETVSGILVPTFDMGSDVATAVTHYKWANYGQVKISCHLCKDYPNHGISLD